MSKKKTLACVDNRITEQVGMLLNLKPNIQSDVKNIDDLFRIYHRVYQQNGVSESYLQSLKSSHGLVRIMYMLSYEYDSKEIIRLLPKAKNRIHQSIQRLQEGCSDSFFIFPLFTRQHTFTGIVRKIQAPDKTSADHSCFSFMVINLGDIPKPESKYNAHMEYIFSDVKPFKECLIDFSIHTEEPIHYIYHRLNKIATAKKKLPLHAKEQNVGNCYLKEMEKAFKTALIDYTHIQEVMADGKVIPVNYAVLLQKSTYEIHKEYIDTLKHRYQSDPDIIKTIDTLFNHYTFNKDIRSRIQKKSPILDSINAKDFSTQIDVRNVNLLIKNIRLLKEITKGFSPETRKELFYTLKELYQFHKNAQKLLKAIIQEPDVIPKIQRFLKKSQAKGIPARSPNFFDENTLDISIQVSSYALENLDRGLFFSKQAHQEKQHHQIEYAANVFETSNRYLQKAHMKYEIARILNQKNEYLATTKDCIENALAKNYVALSTIARVNENPYKALKYAKKAYCCQNTHRTRSNLLVCFKKMIHEYSQREQFSNALRLSMLYLKIEPYDGQIQNSISFFQEQISLLEKKTHTQSGEETKTTRSIASPNCLFHRSIPSIESFSSFDGI